MSKKNKSRSPIEVKESGIHGKGVYARDKIKKGSAIVEYKGERIDEAEANSRYEDNPSTYLFMINENTFIDGLSGGNKARFINHSCEPNCVAYLEDDKRVVIHALKTIRPGDELTYDYQLTKEDSDEAGTSTDYTCRCGARKCKGSMMGQPETH